MMRKMGYTLLRNLPLTLQIALVTHHNNRKIVLILNPQNLLLEGHDFLETLTAGDAVDQEESFTRSHVLLSHRRVFFLTSGIEDIEQRYFFIDHALFAVGICVGSVSSWEVDRGPGEVRRCTFDRGIIFIDEMTLYQLNRQARLSDSTTTNNNEFILSQKLHVQKKKGGYVSQLSFGRRNPSSRVNSLPWRPCLCWIDESNHFVIRLIDQVRSSASLDAETCIAIDG